MKCHFPNSLLSSHQVPITTLGAAYHCSLKILQGTAEHGPHCKGWSSVLMVSFQSAYKNVSGKSKWLLGASVYVVRAGPAPWKQGGTHR